MDDRQYVLAAHQDTDDFHAHVIANRVGPRRQSQRPLARTDRPRARLRRRSRPNAVGISSWATTTATSCSASSAFTICRRTARTSAQRRRVPPAARATASCRGRRVARPYVLDAVDRARDWNDLHKRLGAHGVVVKLVRRGERVQGLAFAEGLDRRAPGCAASRIDRACAHCERSNAASGRSRRRTNLLRPLCARRAMERHGSSDHSRGRRCGDDRGKTLRATRVSTASSSSSLQRGARVQGLAFAKGQPRCARLRRVAHRSALQEGCARAAFRAIPGRSARRHERTTRAERQQRYGIP